jgi:hypothetical protein
MSAELPVVRDDLRPYRDERGACIRLRAQRIAPLVDAEREQDRDDDRDDLEHEIGGIDA